MVNAVITSLNDVDLLRREITQKFDPVVSYVDHLLKLKDRIANLELGLEMTDHSRFNQGSISPGDQWWFGDIETATVPDTRHQSVNRR